jgi:hypothetical protein
LLWSLIASGCLQYVRRWGTFRSDFLLVSPRTPFVLQPVRQALFELPSCRSCGRAAGFAAPLLFPLDCVLRVFSCVFGGSDCVHSGSLPLGRAPW